MQTHKIKRLDGFCIYQTTSLPYVCIYQKNRNEMHIWNYANIIFWCAISIGFVVSCFKWNSVWPSWEATAKNQSSQNLILYSNRHNFRHYLLTRHGSVEWPKSFIPSTIPISIGITSMSHSRYQNQIKRLCCRTKTISLTVSRYYFIVTVCRL